MKHILLFTAILIVATFASCRKARECTCTTTYTSGYPTETTVHTITATKQNAKNRCEANNYSDSSGATNCSLN